MKLLSSKTKFITTHYSAKEVNFYTLSEDMSVETVHTEETTGNVYKAMIN